MILTDICQQINTILLCSILKQLIQTYNEHLNIQTYNEHLNHPPELEKAARGTRGACEHFSQN